MSKEWTTNLEGKHNTGLSLMMFAIMLLTLIVLAVFQSSALLTWSYDLPVSSYSATISSTAEQWHALMERAGLAEFSQSMTERVQSLHDDWPVSE